MAAGLAVLAAARVAVAAEALIVGHVFDASVGPAAGIRFARVDLNVPGLGGASSATTDTDGSFAIALPPGDDAYVFVSISALGYYPYNHWSSGPELRASPLAIGLDRAPYRANTAIGGLVYDASIGRDAPIPGAVIQYTYHSYQDAFPEVPGIVYTGPDGRYGFQQPLGARDYFKFSVAAEGFAPFIGYLGASEVLDDMPRDFGLAPIGGAVRIEPPELHVDCPSRFTVTITNVGSPGETLVILGIGLSFHYGEGVYGRGFSADLSRVHFPLSLAPDEQLRFPMAFAGRGSADDDRFPTLLHLGVDSGARDGNEAVYYGGFNTCDPRCIGDCDGDGSVTVNELIGAANIALGHRDLATCASLDADADARVSVDELAAAVKRSLFGCVR